MGARQTHTVLTVDVHTMSIHPSLASLAVPLDDLKPDPRNARSHDERNIQAVLESLRDHQQRKPIVVQRKDDGTLIVRAGNATCEAARRLKWTHIAAVIVEEGDTEAIKYALRDNRTADLAEWDLPNLGAELRALQADGVSLDELGWQAFEYEPLLAAEWEPPPNTGEEFNIPDKRIGVMFTRAQFEALKVFLGCKPTPEEIMKRLGVEMTR